MGLSPISGRPILTFVAAATFVALGSFVAGVSLLFVAGMAGTFVASGIGVCLMAALAICCRLCSAATSPQAGHGCVFQWRVLQTMQRGTSIVGFSMGEHHVSDPGNRRHAQNLDSNQYEVRLAFVFAFDLVTALVWNFLGDDRQRTTNPQQQEADYHQDPDHHGLPSALAMAARRVHRG